MCVCIGTLLTINRCVGLLKQRLRGVTCGGRLEVCLVRVPGAGVRMCMYLRSEGVRRESLLYLRVRSIKRGLGRGIGSEE